MRLAWRNTGHRIERSARVKLRPRCDHDVHRAARALDSRVARGAPAGPPSERLDAVRDPPLRQRALRAPLEADD